MPKAIFEWSKECSAVELLRIALDLRKYTVDDTLAVKYAIQSSLELINRFASSAVKAGYEAITGDTLQLFVKSTRNHLAHYVNISEDWLTKLYTAFTSDEWVECLSKDILAISVKID